MSCCGHFKRTKLSTISNGVRVANVFTAIVQLMAGFGSLTQIFRLDPTGTMIAVYVILFALLLLFFECRLATTDEYLRRNFGFMFTFRGLAIYLLFIGLLDLGMAGGFFGIIAGGVACANAFIVLFVGLCARCCVVDDEPAINLKDQPSYGASDTGKSRLMSSEKAKSTLLKTVIVEATK
ncbi:TPA: hypothetical protein N0F65_012079 [Lagenidium giganteum]|uniref:COPI associated protein n=1 Tax=Lagenidium giganteum TaxID=4803 RepID=A0AAV2YH03_9STRA|nr:TPA: hypothetical protein N0F65_012079 [Lagenidium giganteum]